MLALVFDAATPLTRIRSQVLKLGRALKQSEKIPAPAAPLPIQPVSTPAPVQPALAGQNPGKGPEPTERLEVLEQPETGPTENSSGEEDEAGLDVDAQISLAELLANMPAPDPISEQFSMQDWMPDPNDKKSAGTQPASASPRQTLENPPQEPPGATRPVPAPKANQFTPPPASNLSPPEDDSIADTQPLLLQPLNRLSDLESVSRSYSRLTYTCLMIPRMPHHYLAGELADNLSQWFQTCCLAFGWRLEGLSIRPEYVQWMVEVSPAISPGNMIRILRQRTSQFIFNQYSMLKNENPSGDFWAPGYLIVSGSQPPTSQMRREFVDESRRRQGLQS